jgi:hypothetical protein
MILETTVGTDASAKSGSAPASHVAVEIAPPNQHSQIE